VRGPETGYIALVAFGSEVAYVTATTASEYDFPPVSDMLLEVVRSVRVPAEQAEAPTDATATTGLGGLGGLGGQATATPGTGGLGGILNRGAATATPTG
jgi:hypothetical protein